jgi:PhnB protein
MAIKQLNPYLNFNGTAEQAIRVYERALGARVENLMRYGDVEACAAKPEDRSLVLHARLHLGGNVIMVSDCPSDRPTATESNVHVALDFDRAEDLELRFEALIAAGGAVTLPVHETFWGAKFGMLTDPFGIRWMFNCEIRKPRVAAV